MTKEKLGETIEFYGKSIYSFCLKLTGSRDIADDLYQDTWLFEITNIFNSTEELEALAGIKLWSSDSISVMHNDFSDGSARGIYITLYEITPGSGQGIMNCDLLYNDVEVYMHGHFVFGENRDLDSIGFGTEKDYYRTFKYGNGKTAYFVKKIESDMNGENETRQHVYFTACKMQFQMSVPLSAEGTKVAEEMISIISGE